MNPKKKGPRDGCAVLWPVWGRIGYYIEMAVLLDDKMPAPDFFTKDEWRMLHRIKANLKELQLDSLKRGKDE